MSDEEKTAFELMAEDIRRIRSSLESLEKSGISQDILVLYIQKESKVKITDIRQVLDAQKNNIKIGYYHFARPSDIANPEQDANAEVQNVLNHINILPPANLPTVFRAQAA